MSDEMQISVTSNTNPELAAEIQRRMREGGPTMEAATEAPPGVDEETGEILDEEAASEHKKQDEDRPQLTLFAGGAQPQKSHLSMRAANKEISNELERDQEVVLTVHARVDEITFKGDDRIHKLAVIDFWEEDLKGKTVAELQQERAGQPSLPISEPEGLGETPEQPEQPEAAEEPTAAAEEDIEFAATDDGEPWD